MSGSYCTIEEANEYFAGRLHAESWSGADSETKEKALRQATRSIDRMPLRGRKTDLHQPLAFPRYPDTEIPEAVKEACCEKPLPYSKAATASAGNYSGKAFSRSHWVT